MSTGRGVPLADDSPPWAATEVPPADPNPPRARNNGFSAFSQGQPHAAEPHPPTRRDRPRLVGLALFFLTFLVYWFTGPWSTPYDFQLTQANNILHGHLDLVEEFSNNLQLVEAARSDGKGFCMPPDDPRTELLAEQPRISPDCKRYQQHSLGSSLVMLPVAAIFGLAANQTLFSALFGALVAPLAFGITRLYTGSFRLQLGLTAFAVFGTQLWYAAADGSAWQFTHTTAVVFVFAAMYATLALRNPLIAGAFVGAAFMCRPSTIFVGFLPLIAFSDRWWAAAAGQAVWQRVRLRPLIELALGVVPFLLLTAALNYMRFGSPFESGYGLSEEARTAESIAIMPYGPFSPLYMPRHITTFFEQMPNFATHGSFIWPNWAGLAPWLVSPPIFYGLFLHLKRYRPVALMAAAAVFVSCLLIFATGMAYSLGLTSFTLSKVPFGLHLWAFWILIIVAVGLAIANRDVLAVACWAAIVPTVLAAWSAPLTGWSQFGYRYSLDFIPLLWLLVVLAVRGPIRWHHKILFGVAFLVNIWGVLWILKFALASQFGWTWVSY